MMDGAEEAVALLRACQHAGATVILGPCGHLIPAACNFLTWSGELSLRPNFHYHAPQTVSTNNRPVTGRVSTWPLPTRQIKHQPFLDFSYPRPVARTCPRRHENLQRLYRAGVHHIRSRGTTTAGMAHKKAQEESEAGSGICEPRGAAAGL